jgi:hypothetical protein
MDGIIGKFKDIPIRRCRCGGEPVIFEEGLSRRDLTGTDNEIYFTAFYNYSVECDECGDGVCGSDIEDTIRAWNYLMEAENEIISQNQN